jgi:hypothetical protein
METTMSNAIANATVVPSKRKAKKHASVAPVAENAPVSTSASLEQAATEHIAKAEAKNSLTPMQVIGTFSENLSKAQSKVVKSLYDDLLKEFAAEGTSKIAIGKTLNRLRDELGDKYRTFMKDCVFGILRKSQATCYSYMALADAATLKFAKSVKVSSALFRIWGAEGCFDTENGKLSPVVDQAILACAGVPEETDSQGAEQWARKFVSTVDKLLKDSRAAQPGGRSWTAEVITAKKAQTIKGFRAFLKNQAVSKDLAMQLFADLVFEAILYGHFTDTELDESIEKANVRIKERADKMESDNPDAISDAEVRKAAKKAA